MDGHSALATDPPVNGENSAKQLISRYESLSHSSRPASVGATSSRRTRVFSISSKLDKSTVRQSFRNLFGIFRKNDKSKYKDCPSSLVLDSDSPHTTIYHDLLVPHIEPFDLSPEIRKSGSLLYLSHTSSPSSIGEPDLPVWITSNVTLTPTHLYVAQQTSLGKPDMIKIPLDVCTDVLSVSASQLHPEERALLPNDEDPKVFELLFSGRPKERFAAPSAQNRSNWVSAIW
jgi:hypothetical protein